MITNRYSHDELTARTLTTSVRTNYCDNHVLGDLPESLTEFGKFYEARSEALRSRIVKLLAAKDAESSGE